MTTYGSLNPYPKFVLYSQVRDDLLRLVGSSSGEEKEKLLMLVNEIVNLRINAKIEAMRGSTYPVEFFGVD